MEQKKIILGLSILVGLFYSCNNPTRVPLSSQEKGDTINVREATNKLTFDTICFNSPIHLKEFIASNKEERCIYAKKTSGTGKNVWVNEILFKRKSKDGFLIVAETYGNYQLIEYSSDTATKFTIVSVNKPSLLEYKMGKKSLLRIQDTIRNSGYLNATDLFFLVDSNDKIVQRLEFFPIAKYSSPEKFDFSVSVDKLEKQFQITKSFLHPDSTEVVLKIP